MKFDRFLEKQKSLRKKYAIFNKRNRRVRFKQGWYFVAHYKSMQNLNNSIALISMIYKTGEQTPLIFDRARNQSMTSFERNEYSVMSNVSCIFQYDNYTFIKGERVMHASNAQYYRTCSRDQLWTEIRYEHKQPVFPQDYSFSLQETECPWILG